MSRDGPIGSRRAVYIGMNLYNAWPWVRNVPINFCVCPLYRLGNSKIYLSYCLYSQLQRPHARRAFIKFSAYGFVPMIDH